MKKYNYDKRVWGYDTASLEPTNWASLKLKYALDSIKNIPKDAKVLEVGCGGGVFTRGIKKYRPDIKVYGVDISQKSLAYARKKTKNITYKKANAYKLPFKNDSLDAVLAIDVLEHLEEPKISVKEIYRVLKKSGVFYSATPLEGSAANIHGWYVKLKGESMKLKQIGHINHFTRNSLVEIFENEGFKVNSCRYTIHLIMQIFDVVYNHYLLKKKYYDNDPEYSVEKYINEQQKGFMNNTLKKVYQFIVSIHYWESRFLSKVPGLTISITCKK